MSYRKLSSHYLLFLYFQPDIVSIIHGSKVVVSWEPTVLLFIFCWWCTQLLPLASSLYHFVLHDGLCCTSLLCTCKTLPRERCHAPQQGRRALEISFSWRGVWLDRKMESQSLLLLMARLRMMNPMQDLNKK